MGQSPKVLKQEVSRTEKKKFIFLDEEKKEELLLPITPESYEIDHGISSNKLSLTELCDNNMPGRRYMMTIKIKCVFPAQRYNFVNEGAVTEPYFYVRKFENWCDSQKILRFMISGTNVNTTCFIESILFGEDDGTGDVNAEISVAQYWVLKKTAQKTKEETKNNARTDSGEKSSSGKSYTVAKGDTLGAICRKYYGDSSTAKCKEVAAKNGIKNINLIYPGQVIKL